MSRQTYTYLRKLFERKGVAPRRQFGQNFLVDLNLHEVIVSEAEVGGDDVILEVGSGTGALTKAMLERGAEVVAVEIDPAMAALTTEAVGERPDFQLLHRDALFNKNRIAPEVLDAVEAALAKRPGRRFKVVANLPYNIATPLISNLLVLDRPTAERMVVTIQLELAQRILAAPSTSDYSALSVLVQSLAKVELLRTLPPSVFWPRPQVESAIIRVIPDAALRAEVGDVRWFQQVVRQIFTLRRKNLRRVLHGFYRDRMNKDEIDALLASIGLVGEVRADSLDAATHQVLARTLRERLGQAALPEATGEDADD